MRPNLITGVATTRASVADAEMTTPVNAALHRRDLAPGRHYLDSGYGSARHVLDAARLFGITLVTPLPADSSRQARAGDGYDRTAFAIDYDARTVTCPQGKPSTGWTPARQEGRGVIVVRFGITACRPCPARQLCTTARRNGRQLTILPRDQHELQAAVRAGQQGEDWQEDYKRRAGIEGAVSQAVTVTGCRRARYRGLGKTHLEHAYAAVALNLCRLDAYWNDTPLNRGRTSHLARLSLATSRTELTTNISGGPKGREGQGGSRRAKLIGRGAAGHQRDADEPVRRPGGSRSAGHGGEVLPGYRDGHGRSMDRIDAYAKCMHRDSYTLWLWIWN